MAYEGAAARQQARRPPLQIHGVTFRHNGVVATRRRCLQCEAKTARMAITIEMPISQAIMGQFLMDWGLRFTPLNFDCSKTQPNAVIQQTPRKTSPEARVTNLKRRSAAWN